MNSAGGTWSQQAPPIRIVPLRGAPPPRTGAPAAAHLTYRGGPLLTAAEATLLFWGPAWTEAANARTAERITEFHRFVLGSEYIGQLAEYGVPGQAIGRGHIAEATTIADRSPPVSLTDSAIQQLLLAELGRQSLPAATSNSLYVVFSPPGVTVSAGRDRSCQTFCGYHDRTADGSVFYAVVPYPGCTGCLAGLAVPDAFTSVCSHELAEAITDPVPGTGWYDDANGEIGDICAWQNRRFAGYEVQRLWSNQAAACV